MGAYGRSRYKRDYGFSVILLYLCIVTTVGVFQCTFSVIFPLQQEDDYGLLEYCHVRKKIVRPILVQRDTQFTKPTLLLPTQKVQPKPSKKLHVLPMRQNLYKYTVSQVEKVPVIRKFIGNEEQDELEGRMTCTFFKLEPIPSFTGNASFSLVFVGT